MVFMKQNTALQKPQKEQPQPSPSQRQQRHEEKRFSIRKKKRRTERNVFTHHVGFPQNLMDSRLLDPRLGYNPSLHYPSVGFSADSNPNLNHNLFSYPYPLSYPYQGSIQHVNMELMSASSPMLAVPTLGFPVPGHIPGHLNTIPSLSMTGPVSGPVSGPGREPLPVATGMSVQMGQPNSASSYSSAVNSNCAYPTQLQSQSHDVPSIPTPIHPILGTASSNINIGNGNNSNNFTIAYNFHQNRLKNRIMLVSCTSFTRTIMFTNL